MFLVFNDVEDHDRFVMPRASWTLLLEKRSQKESVVMNGWDMSGWIGAWMWIPAVIIVLLVAVTAALVRTNSSKPERP